MSRWLDVRPLQDEPQDLGLDATERIQFGFNIMAIKVPSATYDDEIVKVLTDAGIPSGSLFISSKSVVPEGSGPFLTIRVTGGPLGIRTHNVTTGDAYRRSTAQIVVCAGTTNAARGLAHQALTALAAVKNQDVVP